MKKVTTLFALAAIAGGSALAVVESDNIVGFQDLGGTASALISVSPTFTQIGGVAANTLADISVNEAGEEGGLTIRFFDNYGYPLAEGDYVYVKATNYGGDYDGWYLEDCLITYDFDASYCRNSKQIPAGTGFVLIPANASAQLKFKGEVKQANQEISGAASALIRSGNATPRDFTLADFSVNAAGEEGGLNIRFFDSYGYPLAEGDYVYVAATNYGGDYDGWYLEDCLITYDFDASYCRNSTPVPAGKGFVLIPANASAALILPNPVQ